MKQIEKKSFSYQRNWHGRGDLVETLVHKIIPLLCSEWKGKDKNSNERMKIPVEPVCVIFRSDGKLYDYPENLIIILFKYKKCWCYIEIVIFYIVVSLWKSLRTTELYD